MTIKPPIMDGLASRGYLGIAIDRDVPEYVRGRLEAALGVRVRYTGEVAAGGKAFLDAREVRRRLGDDAAEELNDAWAAAWETPDGPRDC